MVECSLDLGVPTLVQAESILLARNSPLRGTAKEVAN